MSNVFAHTHAHTYIQKIVLQQKGKQNNKKVNILSTSKFWYHVYVNHW